MLRSRWRWPTCTGSTSPARRWPRRRSGRRTSSSACRAGSWTSRRRCSARRATRCCSTAAPARPARSPSTPPRPGCELLVIDTAARHVLADGEYADRRAECEQAAAALGVPALRDIADLGALAGLADPVLRRRARHVVTENRRVLDTVAVAAGGPAGRGRAAADRLARVAAGRLRDLLAGGGRGGRRRERGRGAGGPDDRRRVRGVGHRAGPGGRLRPGPGRGPCPASPVRASPRRGPWGPFPRLLRTASPDRRSTPASFMIAEGFRGQSTGKPPRS